MTYELYFHYISLFLPFPCRLREERGDDRALALEQKPRDLSSQNGELLNGHDVRECRLEF